MTLTERLARFGDRIFDRLRHPEAFAIADRPAADGALDSLTGCKYAVLVTYKRNGTPVPSPVWVAVDATGVAYVKTARHAGKVKRIAHTSRVLVAPSDMRGKPVGPAMRATARILPPEEWEHAEQTLAAAYGLGRQISERLLASDDGSTAAYIAMVADPAP